jgi:signal transduction histidine kinase
MKSFNLRFWQSQFPLIGILAALVILAAISTISIFSINDFQRRAQLVNHTHNVLAALGEMLSLLKDAQVGSRGFVITGQPIFLEPYQASQEKVPRQIELLRALTEDNPNQQHNIQVLQNLINDAFINWKNLIELRRNETGVLMANAYVSGGKGVLIFERNRAQIDAMQALEKELLAKRERQAGSSARHIKAMIAFGSVAAYLIICGVFWLLRREIQQRQLADQALVDANNVLVRHASQLETTNNELESFSYSISHDLRIPLRAISGFARMLEEDYGDKIDGEGQRLLKVIRDNSKRMGDLIDDLLAFSRLGRKPVSTVEVDMNGLVVSAMEELQRKDECTNAKVVLDVLPEAWGDRALLQQVWLNLISNAFKYSSTREQAVICIAGKIDGNESVYSISDNGVGFDMQYYNKLFGVFQRLHGADEFPGTGVGLAIVQRIVARHGGHVWAESKIDQGATFFFALPMKG